MPPASGQPRSRHTLSRHTLAAFPLPALLLTLAAAPAAAADCFHSATQADMNICAGQDLEKADTALNILYRQMQARLAADPAQARRLTETQRAWVAFRDAECRFVAQPGPGAGTMEPTVEAQCRTDLTERRSRDFQRYLHCPEGDLSCPLPPR